MQASTPLPEPNQLTAANNKYQKALKQINKLIAINNSCKKQLIKIQEQYDQLTKNYTLLQQKYFALREQNQTLSQGQGQRLPMMGKVTLSYQQPSSQVSIKSMEEKNQEILLQNKVKQNFSPLSVPGKQLQNTGTISEYIDTKRLLQEKEQKIGQKETQISCLVERLRLKDEQNADLMKKYISISDSYNHVTSEIYKKTNPDLVKLQKQKSELENELVKQRSISVGLALQLQNIKKATSRKITSYEPKNTEQKLSLGEITDSNGRPQTVPFHQSFYSMHLQPVNKNLIENIDRTDPYFEHCYKKVRNLEAEILRLKKQFAERKQKYKYQINKLKHQLLDKEEALKKQNAFIQKQQYFIQNYALKSGVEGQPKMPANEGVDGQNKKNLSEDKIIRMLIKEIGLQKYQSVFGVPLQHDNIVKLPSVYSSASKYSQQFSNSKYASQTKISQN